MDILFSCDALNMDGSQISYSQSHDVDLEDMRAIDGMKNAAHADICIN